MCRNFSSWGLEEVSRDQRKKVKMGMEVEEEEREICKNEGG
jgi:hypothetical protein